MTYSSPTAFRFIVVEFFYRKVSSISQHTKISRLSRITQSNNNKIKIYKEFVFFFIKRVIENAPKKIKVNSKLCPKTIIFFYIILLTETIILLYLFFWLSPSVFLCISFLAIQNTNEKVFFYFYVTLMYAYLFSKK